MGADDAFGDDRSLWHADCKAQTSLVVTPTHKGLPYEVATEAGRAKTRGERGTLFYARNLRWTSQVPLAARTDRPLHGGASWTALRHADERVLCAMALWFNSTLGMMVHWSQAGHQQLGRARTQLGTIERMPCPNAEMLTKAQLRKAERTFNALQAQPLLAANQAPSDPTRANIDQAAAESFGLPAVVLDAVGEWRALWTDEPTVRG